MAIIKCPECNKEMSDTVKKCPHCGYKIKNKSKKNKITIILIVVIAIILVICIIKAIGNIKISLFGTDYSILNLLFSNSDEEEISEESPYTKEQQNEEIYDFIKRRSDYAVMNINGNDLANTLNTGGRMVDTSVIANYKYGRNKELTINEYVVMYKQGAHHIKIIADNKDDKVIAIKYFCNDGYKNTDRDSEMTKIFEKIKSLSKTEENMDFWTFNDSVDKWQSGDKVLYEKGLGIKVVDRYQFIIVACPNREFYNEYSTNL